MNWNNVSDCLPPVEEDGVSTEQVVVTDGYCIAQAFYALDGSGGWYQPNAVCRGGGTYLPFEPTHWAPIPDFPKVEE